mmetsp:Transcript_49626/g.146665  ORF Transcript_49626/g.146665 Transcript_49626/m.146665 type:complete len:218 (-) Transcript_49626:3036-3689(-)
MQDLTLSSRRLFRRLPPMDGCCRVWQRSATVASVIWRLPERSMRVRWKALPPRGPAPGAWPAKWRSITQRPRRPTSVMLWPLSFRGPSPSAGAGGKVATCHRFSRAIAPSGKSFQSTPAGSSMDEPSPASRICTSLARGRPLRSSMRGASSATAWRRRLAPRPESFRSCSCSRRMAGRLSSASVMCASVLSDGISSCRSATVLSCGKYCGVTRWRNM